jgi:hypothetical protein
VAAKYRNQISREGILASPNTTLAGVEDLSPRALLHALNWGFYIRTFWELQGMDEKASIFTSCSHQQFVKAKERKGIRFPPYISTNSGCQLPQPFFSQSLLTIGSISELLELAALDM